MATKRALLIGINRYPKIEASTEARSLVGCLEDVETMHALLSARGFTDIQTLTDDTPSQPTRANILAAMDALVDAVAEGSGEGDGESNGAGDLVVLFFAGHGSLIRSQKVEGSRRLGHIFQTLVTADSGRMSFRAGVPSFPNRDILDFEIEHWVRRLNALTPEPQVQLIFDCCHSAGLSSDARRAAVSHPRLLIEDQRPIDELGVDDSVRQFLEGGQIATDDGASMTRGAAGWRRGTTQRALVLAACRNDEFAGGDASGGNLTFALGKALQRHPTARRWQEIFDPVSENDLRALRQRGDVEAGYSPIYTKVVGLNSAQHPVRSGDGPIFDFAGPQGAVDFSDEYPAQTVAPLRKYAAVIGIAEYGGSWTNLNTARHDAEVMARVLRDLQGYEIIEPRPGQLTLSDKAATFLGIFRLLYKLRKRVAGDPGSAAVIYFAGHGASVPDAEERRLHGYLVPHGGQLDAPRTWLPMNLLRLFLAGRPAGSSRRSTRLSSRHLLLVLDCCFAGTIKLDFGHRGQKLRRPIFASEFRRFVEGRAWQVLTSSQYNQIAMDRDPRGPRGEDSHSPFAGALIEALSTDLADAGDAEGRRDCILSVGELYQFLDQRLKVLDFQNPGLASLDASNTGQFIFQVPGWEPVTTPDPPLVASNNPWPGRHPYGPGHDAFHGQEEALLDLLGLILHSSDAGILALTGATASGKTSLAEAGLKPLLQDLLAQRHRIRRWVARHREGSHVSSPTALHSLRGWMRQLELVSLLDNPVALQQRVQTWVSEQGWVAESRALADRTRVLPPQVTDLLADDGSSLAPWMRETDLFSLLQQPEQLASHLRFWHQSPGLADYVHYEDDGTSPLPPVLKPWQVVSCHTSDLIADGVFDPQALETLLTETGPASSRLLIVDHWRPTRRWPDAQGSLLTALDVLTQTTDGVEQPPWRVLLLLDLDHVLAVDASRTVQLQAPQRQQLRDAIEQPLLDSALLMPKSLVDTLVEGVIDTPAPFALLSDCLHEMFLATVERRRLDGERSIDDDAYKQVRNIDGPLRRRMQRVFDPAPPEPSSDEVGGTSPSPLQSSSDEVGGTSWLAVSDAQRQHLFRLLRRFALDPRPLKSLEWTSSEDASEPRRWFDILLQLRLVVCDREHLHLTHPQLCKRWSTFKAWRRKSATEPFEALLPGLARSALAWERKQRPQRLLWHRHPQLLDLIEIGDELNALERRFLQASHSLWSSQRSRELAEEALRVYLQRWDLGLLLAAEAVDFSLEDPLESSLGATMEILRRILALAPWSLRVPLPGTALGLTTDAETGCFVVRADTSEQDFGFGDAPVDPAPRDDGHPLAWSVDPQSLDVTPTSVDVPPRVDAVVISNDEADLIVDESQDPARQRRARVLPFSPHFQLQDLTDRRLTRVLRGPTSTPRYFAWSPQGEWLATLSKPSEDAVTYRLSTSANSTEDRTPTDELRLWRLPKVSGDFRVASEPRLVNVPSSDVSPGEELSRLIFLPGDQILVSQEGKRRPTFYDLTVAIPQPIRPEKLLDGLNDLQINHWHLATAAQSSWLFGEGRSRTGTRQRLASWRLDAPSDTGSWETQRRPLGLPGPVQAISRGGSYALIRSGGGLQVQPLHGQQLRGSLDRQAVVEFSPDDQFLVQLSQGELVVFALPDLENPISRRSIEHPPARTQLLFDPTGRWLLMQPPSRGREEVEAQLWAFDTGGRLSAKSQQVAGCHFHFDPTGSVLAVIYGQKVQCLKLKAPNGSHPKILNTQSSISEVSTLAFDTTGERLAFGCVDGAVTLVRCDGSRPVERLRSGSGDATPNGVQQLAFSNQGDILAVALGELKPEPGDVPLQGAFMLTLKPPEPPQVQLYDLSPKRLVAKARACAGRQLSKEELAGYLGSSPPPRPNLEPARKLLHGSLAATSPIADPPT